MQNVRISNDSGLGGLSVTYDSTTGELTLVHSNIYSAISSAVETKTFAMGSDTVLVKDLGALNGNKLTLTGMHSVDGAGWKGITVGAGKELSLNVVTSMDNFDGAAIATAEGAAVHLSDITFGSGNDYAVDNDGTMTLAGTNIFNSSVIGDSGDTTVKSGTTTTNTIFTQENLDIGVVTPASHGEFINNSTVNVVNLSINNELSKYTNKLNKTTNISGTLTNAGEVVNQGTIITDAIISSGTVTNTGSITAASGITNSGIFTNDNEVIGAVTNNTGAAYTNNGTLTGDFDNASGAVLDTTAGTITGDITNSGESAPDAGDAGIVKALADSITGSVVNDGIMQVTGGTASAPITLAYNIVNGANGTGETTLTGAVTTAAAREITQSTLNIGDSTGAGTDGILTNNGLATAGGGITADNINILTANSQLNNNGDIALTGTMVNAGTITNDGESALIDGGTIINNNLLANTNGSAITSDITNNAGATVNNTALITGKITNKAESGLTPAGVVNTTAAGFTGGIDNDGTLNITGGTSAVPEVLGSAINNDTEGTGVTNIAGVVDTNGNNITQKTINVGKNSAGADVGNSGLTNGATIITDNINVTAGNNLVLENGSVTTVADAINIASGGSLTMNDDAAINGALANGITITDGTLNLNAATTDLTLVNDITGAGTSGVSVNVSGAGTTTISSVITNSANPVNVGNGSTLVLNDNGAVLTGGVGSPDTDISLGANSELDINSAAGRVVDSDITAVPNSGAAVRLNKDGSNSVITLDNTINGADSVSIDSGKVNIGVAGDNKTQSSQTLGNAALNIANNAEADITTTEATYSLNNDVTGAGNTSKLKLSGNAGTPGTSNSGTNFVVNTPVSNALLEIAQGELYLPNENNFINNSEIQIDTNSTINTLTGTTDVYNTVVQFANNSQVKLDINAINGLSDKFTNAVQNPNDKVILTDVNLQGLDKVVQNGKIINLSESSNIQNIEFSNALKNQSITAMTPIRRMAAKFMDDGTMQIVPSSGRNNWKDYNPAVLATPVAAQIGGYLTQLNSYDEAFRNMDMYMLMSKKQRIAHKFRNKIASAEITDVAFDPTMAPMEQQGAWLRPYATFENISLHNGPRVENMAYGSYFGGESELTDLGHGWEGAYGIYIGYNGSQQNYSGVNIMQNGGTLGLVGMAYKNNFFIGGTVNAGASVGDANTSYGQDDFTMISAGIAAKTGYNWELFDGVFIVQPSMIMSYSFVDTLDYTNSARVKISASPLNAIHMEPGIKFIGNLNKGWQPYAGISMIFNLMDKNDMMANDIDLPSMSIKPYVKYGLGVRKTWGERFTGFFQTFMTNGGRNGVGLQAGFRWTVGKAGSAPKVNKSETKINEEQQVTSKTEEQVTPTKEEQAVKKTKPAKKTNEKIKSNNINKEKAKAEKKTKTAKKVKTKKTETTKKTAVSKAPEQRIPELRPTVINLSSYKSKSK